MKTLRLLMLLVVLVSITGVLFAGGFALSGVASKAQSMGGNFRGLADDPSAIYWNPAGLGFMTNSYLSLAATGIAPASKYQYTGNAPGWNTSEIEAEKKLYLFPNLYGVWGGESKLKLGLGVFVPNGLGATWDAYSLPATMPVPVGVDGNGNPVYQAVPITWAAGFPEKDLKSSVSIIDVHPTAAYQITDCLSAGMGVSLMYGDITIIKLMPHVGATPQTSYGYYMPTLFEMSGTGYGVGANFGLLYNMNEKLGIGLSGKIPATISLEGDADINMYVNSIISAGLMGTPAFGPFVASGKTTGKAELKLPGDLGLGLKYNITDKWLVTADVTYTTWSEFDKVIIKMDPGLLQTPHPANPDSLITIAPIPTERTLNTKWEDTFRFGLGTEFKLSPVSIRAGFYWDDTPIPDETMTPTFPDINEKFSYNVGIGYPWCNWLIEANYQMIQFPEREVSTQTADNNIGKYNNNVHAFNFGLTYKF